MRHVTRPIMTPKARRLAWALVAILMVALAPVLSVMASIGIASAYGCKVNEAATYPCMVAGMDLGELLATMFIAGWFGLVTLPLGALALLVWIAVAIIVYVASRNQSVA